MNIQRTVKFLLHRRRKGVDNNLNVRMRVTIRGCDPVDFPLGYSIDAADWDAEGQRVLDGVPCAVEVNRTVAYWRGVVDDIFARYEIIEKRIPSREEFRDLFNDTIGRETALSKLLDRDSDFFSVIDRFVSDVGRSNQWSTATYEKFAALRSHFHDFKPSLKIDDVNDDLLRRYVTFLMHDCGMMNTTVSKHLAFVRWFLRWAFNAGLYHGRSHETFKPKIKGAAACTRETVYCTRDELRLLMDHEFGELHKSLERVRDVFVFQCFTGLRYSDVAKLKRSDVKGDFIKVVTKKTLDGLVIELNRYSRAILDKYKDCHFPDDLALPVISNARMNDALKSLGQVCGLDDKVRLVYFRGDERVEEVYPKWALLTTHVGRHTFIVSALMLRIPVEVVMKWTGHSSYQTMKPYVAIVDELKKDSMREFDDIF